MTLLYVLLCVLYKKNITKKSYRWGCSWINGAYTVRVVYLQQRLYRRKGVRLTQSPEVTFSGRRPRDPNWKQ